MAGPRSKVLRCFPPIADRRSRILILGTMPGPESLRKKEYFGFKHNQFWKIMRGTFGVERELNYAEKKRLLLRNRIALWDVVGSCEREGAADHKIRNVAPNPVDRLLRRYSGIRTILFDGKTAEKLFRRHFPGLAHVPAYYLPSTSPAHASLSYEVKFARWCTMIRKKLAEGPTGTRKKS